MTEQFQLFAALPAHIEDALRASSTVRSFVYFIQADDGRVKIGKARRPSQRLKELQTGSSRNLRLVGLLLGDRQAERVLHERYKVWCVGGEWFSPHPEVLEAVRQSRWEIGVAA